MDLTSKPPDCKDYIVLDLEIAHPVREKADWDRARRGELGMSLACVYDGGLDSYRFYDAHNLSMLMDDLETAPLVVGFNSLEFDLPCIAGVAGRMPLVQGQYDILQKVWGAVGSRFVKGYGLGAIAERTFGIPKFSTGAHAPELYAAGRMAELYSYCLHDVFLTRLLFEHILCQGYIIDVNGDKLYLEDNGRPE
jgi:hypothetical protein